MKKKLSTILLAWQKQYKDDAGMSVFAGLYGQLKKEKHMFQDEEVLSYLATGPATPKVWARQEKEKREKKERDKREREARREREQGGDDGGRRRRSFNFERVSQLYPDLEV